MCRSKTDNARKQRVNYLEATHSEEEKSEPEEIQQITQINRILPDKNDNHGIRLKSTKMENENYGIRLKSTKMENTKISQSTPVTIMPNDPKLYNQKHIHPLKERYQDVNKNEIKFLEKIWANIEYNGETTKLPILITQRKDITPQLGVNWLNQLPNTINKISLDDHTN